MTIPSYPQNVPAQESPVVDRDGKLTQPWWFFLQSLFNRTGAETGIALSVGNDLTATGSAQGDALALGNDINEVLTTDSGTGVSLFQMQPGMLQIVFNGGANNLAVYPSDGYAIDAIAENSPYTLATTKTQIFFCYSATQIRTLQLG